MTAGVVSCMLLCWGWFLWVWLFWHLPLILRNFLFPCFALLQIPSFSHIYSCVLTEIYPTLHSVILSLEAPNKFGKSIPEFGETHSSVLGCERRPVAASIMSRSCFASFFHFHFSFSSHYLNNVMFYRQ